MKLAHRFLSTASVTPERVFVALGSNVGHRAYYIDQALRSMRSYARIIDTSFLYQSKPMYLESQPNFFNAVVEIQTHHEPHHLLSQLKETERYLGRQHNTTTTNTRYGPRCIDLDLLLYGQRVIKDAENGINSNDNNTNKSGGYSLTVPHERISERPFVLRPLCDIDSQLTIPGTGCDVQQLLSRLGKNTNDVCRVTPVRKDKHFTWNSHSSDPLLMGIINATPDSFSDGGVNNSADAALQTAGEFVAHGFDIVDVGGYSTRPGAREVLPISEELNRVLPIIEKIRKEFPHIVISCDTFRGLVAREALAGGADIINDVGAGTWDDSNIDSIDSNENEMCKVLSEGINGNYPAWIAMHSRGRPDTMDSHAHYNSNNVVDVVGCELKQKIRQTGIPKWRVIADAGIGFAKNSQHNLQLLSGWHKFKQKCGTYPTLVGLSRKRFLNMDTTTTSIEARDWASAGAVAATLASGGVDIVRVHRPQVAHAVRAAHRIALHNYKASS